MQTSTAPSSAVLVAVRERYERLVLDLPGVESRLADALRAYQSEAAKLESFKGELEELREFLTEHGEIVQRPTTSDSMAASANMQILMRARVLLADGRHWPTREIYEELKRQGQVFTALNPVQRLSQLLSGSDWFASDRARGWSLAQAASPAPSGAEPRATEPAGEKPEGT